ncbi:MAG: ROK family protein [Schwartzia sp.]|nr:ROK family protein [Schwartzia sp. (in: firmicutes)]
MGFYALFDIGGTEIKYGAADENGCFVKKGSVKNPVREEGIDSMLELLEERLGEIKKEFPVNGIGVSTAGVVDTEKGVIEFASDNIPGYTGTKLRDFFEKLAGVPCTVENDVNCAGLGEAWLGAGKKASPLVCITLGTGVGGCVIINGKLIHGTSNFAGEVGYIPLAGGTLEELASTSALVRRVALKKSLDVCDVDGKKVFEWAQKGDSICLEAIDSMLDYLAQGIWTISCIVNPEAVVIGGGIAAQKKFLEPMLKKKLSNVMISNVFETTRISFADLGNDAGMLGALHCILELESVK